MLESRIMASRVPKTIPPAIASAVSVSVKVMPSRKRSEEHTSELQSRLHLVCRLLLEKKKNNRHIRTKIKTGGQYLRTTLIELAHSHQISQMSHFSHDLSGRLDRSIEQAETPPCCNLV